MHPTDANEHTPALTTPQRDRAPWRRRARRLGVPTAALVAVLTTALVGSGLSSGTSAAPAERDAGTGRGGALTLAAGTGTLGAASTSTTAGTTASTTASTTAGTVQAATTSTTSASAKAAAKAKKAKAKKAARAKAKMKAKKRKAKLVRMSKKYPRKAAKKMMRNRGYSARQQSCVVKLWNKESNWRLVGRQPELVGVRHPAGASRPQDGQRRS